MDKKESYKDPHFDWPYATSYLLETLDPELIEAHAEHILSRALNIGRAVGFIGAGVAMSYGRISWQTLVQTELRRVTAKHKRAKDDTRWNLDQASDARRLWDTLDTLKISRTDIRPERYPMLFQVSEQLDNALNKFLGTHDEKGLRAHATNLTISDKGHAYQLLYDALTYDQPEGVPGKVDKDLEAAAWEFIESILQGEWKPELLDRVLVPIAGKEITASKATDGSAYRLFFDVGNAEFLRRSVEVFVRRDHVVSPDLWSILDKAVRSATTDRPARAQNNASVRGRQPSAAQTRSYLLPTDRYLIGVLLYLAPRRIVRKGPRATQRQRPPKKWRLPAQEWWGGIADEVAEFQRTLKNRGNPPPKESRKIAVTTRHGLVTQKRDPLLYMQERLRINRFITTNFDHEIERLFKDQSFRQAGSDGTPESLLRPRYKNIIFDNVDSGELAAFAVSDRSLTGAVVHLHGRAENDLKEKDNKIVITETDYQRRYLRPDSSRKLVDDAIRLAFGSSPMVFVGSNMGEDDLLRPLRQFMSGPARVGDRVAIALVPAMTDRAKRTEEKIALLGRYGVYAIHFGNCRFWAGEREPTTDAERPLNIEWLAWFHSLQQLARDALKFLAEESEASSIRSDYDAAQQALTKLSDTYIKGPELTPAAYREIGGDSDEAKARLVRERNNVRRPPEKSNRGRALVDKFELKEPKEIEGTKIEKGSTVEIKVEVLLLNCVLNWLVREFPRKQPAIASFRKKRSAKKMQMRTAKAFQLALQGATDSALAIFTCARLEKVKRDWDGWKENWFNLPLPAIPVGPEPISAELKAATSGIVATDAVMIHRHQIQMSDRPGQDPLTSRFYTGAPSQSSFGLIEALDSKHAAQFRNARGRRFLLLSSSRGLGKGHFFSSIEDCLGCKEDGRAASAPRVLDFLRALNPRGKTNRRSKWIGMAFMGLSFSQEVMSAFDRIIQLLYTCLYLADRGVAASLNFERLEYDRIESLRAVLSGWKAFGKKNPDRPERVLIAFNGFSIFYDHEGKEKNGQIRKLCELIFHEEFSAAPIDFVLLCQNGRLPDALVGAAAGHDIVAMLPDTTDSRARARAERILQATDMGPRGAPSLGQPKFEVTWQNTPDLLAADGPQKLLVHAPAARKASDGKRRPAVAVHVLRETRAIVIASTYFTRVALLLARNLMWEEIDKPSGQPWKAISSKRLWPRSAPGRKQRVDVSKLRRRGEDELYGIIFDGHGYRTRNQLRLSFDAMEKAARKVRAKHFAPVAMALIAILEEFGERKTRAHPPERIKQFHVEVTKTRKTKNSAEACITAAEHILDRELDRAKADSLKGLLPGIVERLDSYMRELFELADGGRFLLTLIFASAYESTSALEPPDRNTPSASESAVGKGYDPQRAKTFNQVTDAMLRVIKVLANVKLSLKGVPKSARANAVIEEVISNMRSRADRDDPLPSYFDLGHGDWTNPALKPLLHTLMMEIIWHLSIIGQPVEQSVLQCCPRIVAAYCAINVKGKVSIETCVEAALDLAIYRCLIFRLVGKTRGATSGAGGKSMGQRRDDTERYTVHRQVQSYVFRSLGAATSEFQDADQFTLSLFASQPDDLPRLSSEAHREISKVIAALSGYPHGSEAVDNALPELANANSDPDELRNRRRRLRATLGIMRSIYSVAVLSRFDRRTGSEELLQEGFFEEHRRSVRWLLKAGAVLTDKDNNESPFYAEEIVWLCNECAVLSTVEGRLSDAQGLFPLAFDAVKRIEPDESGPLHVRLLLNRSVCDIERGHTIEARSVLERIAGMTDEHPVPPLLARGYLGLIDHIAGEIAQAERNYRAAISGLVKIGRSRSASIFSRHLGDMLGKLCEPRTAEALQLIEDAIHFAQEGGHEDIRYLALLSLAKLHIRRTSDIDGANTHKELDAIDAYGRVVGMPRILCEVALTRARLLLRQGETERAGTLVNESLEIASMNDMRLRKVSGLLLLAEINLRRNQRKAARPLLSLGITMAKKFNSHFSLTHAQSLEDQLDAELGGR